MPTSKPRITITLTEHQHAVLSRMATLGKGSMSAIVTDMLDTMVPVLERVVKAMQAAQDAPKHLHAGMLASLEKAEQDMQPLFGQVMGQLDLMDELVGAVDAQQPPPPPVARKSPRPPASNRGGQKILRTITFPNEIKNFR